MSTLLEQASLVLIPSGYKEDTVYSVIPSNGSGDMSFTRASDGTRINFDGLVENTPWNILQYSEQFNNAIWNKSASGTGSLPTVTTNYETAPNGTLTADRIQFSKGSGTTMSDFSLAVQPSIILSSIGTFSIYFKSNTLSNQNVLVYWAAGQGQVLVVTPQWQQFTLNSLSANIAGIVFGTRGGSGSYFNGGDNSLDISVWAAQINLGTLKPYFPTTDRLNVPRLTYQNGGGGCPSLLLEPQRTNLALHSEDFTNVVYTKTNISATANTTTALNGIQNADSILELATTTTHESYQRISMTSTQQYTQSCFLKANGRNRVCMQIFDNATQYASAIYDLSTGVVVSSSGTAKIESMGNGWYRCAITGTSPATGLGYCVLGLCENTYTNSSVMQSYLGDITKGVYWWGFQLELGSYATSYIPTVASSATRIADACSKTGISSLIGQTEGTLFTDFVCNGFQNYGTPLSVNSSSTSNNIWITTFANGNIRAELYNGAVQASITYTGGVIGQRYKLAFAYKTNDFAMYVNGSLVGTDVSGTTFSGTTLSRLDFDLVNPAIYSLSLIQVNQAILFKTRLTNSELAQITTI